MTTISAPPVSLQEWLAVAQSTEALEVRRTPLHALHRWHFESRTGNLTHETGRFFSVEGLRVQMRGDRAATWMQPVINQSEVGVLGLLVGYIEGELSALVQRKVEPGNVNVAQVSPTLQATESNYTRVHGGSAPLYIEDFLGPQRGTILADRLQMEQAARYCGKRNRNVIILVDPGVVPVGDHHRWVPIRELFSLALVPNALNLDTRSVLACLPARCVGADGATSDDRVRAIRAWLAGVDSRSGLDVKQVPLNSVDGWSYDGERVVHHSGHFFDVVGVSVHAPAREVPTWDQPLVRSRAGGVIGFLCQEQQGILNFLVRGVIEPGDPSARIGPTVQCIPQNHAAPSPFLNEIESAPPASILLRTVQSEEGGRFFHDERVLTVVEVPPGLEIDVPPDFMWLSLAEIKALIERGVVNIEARSLVACLPIAMKGRA